MPSDFTKFTTYTRRFFSGTLLSRFSGMFRDMAMAYAFGDHPTVAAFMVAFRFSQFFRRIFGEGSLQATFIPHYEGLRIESEKKAAVFFRGLFFYLSLILVSIVIASCLILNGATYFGITESFKEILLLTSWMMPSLFFVCLYALNAAALQCHGSFFLSGVAPVLCNLTWIAGCVFLKNTSMPYAMVYFSLFVVGGFLLQWAVTLPKLLKKLQLNFREWATTSLTFPKDDIKKISKAFLLATIGVGASQINSTLDALFAHYANIKGPVYLWYAIRIQQLPMALFGIALVSAITPTLTRAIKDKKIEEASHLFIKAKKRLSVFMIACMFGILTLALPAITLIFKHGKFHDDAIFSTASCLYAYGLGLLPATFVMLYSSVFYAYGDFKTPTRASVISVLANIFLNALFVMGFSLQETSVAIATSISTFINLLFLHKKLEAMQFIKKDISPLRNESLKTALAAILATIVTFVIEKIGFGISLSFLFKTHPSLPSTFTQQLLYLFISTASFCLSMWVFCYLLKCHSLLALIKEFAQVKAKPSPTLSQKNPAEET